MAFLDTIKSSSIGLAKTAALKSVGSDKLPLVNSGLSVIEGAYKNGLSGALNSAVNGGLIQNLVGSGLYSLFRKNNDGPLHARLRMDEAEKVVKLAHALQHARKNLWLLSISPYQDMGLKSLVDEVSNKAGDIVSQQAKGKYSSQIGTMASQAAGTAMNSVISNLGIDESLGGGLTSTFNMLATDVSYSPITFEGEQHNVGSAIIDIPKTASPTDISITTMDDEQGTIKRFFDERASATLHKDGTVGVLADRLVVIRILHAFVSDKVNISGYEQNITARPVSVEYDLSRKENAMEEFTMRFIQTDTFI